MNGLSGGKGAGWDLLISSLGRVLAVDGEVQCVGFRSSQSVERLMLMVRKNRRRMKHEFNGLKDRLE